MYLGYFLIRIKWFISFSTIIYFTYPFREHLGCCHVFLYVVCSVSLSFPLLQTMLDEAASANIIRYHLQIQFKQLNYYLNECRCVYVRACACMLEWGGKAVSSHSTLCLYCFYFNSFLEFCIYEIYEKHIKHKYIVKCSIEKKSMSRHLILLAPQKDLVCPLLITTPKR